MKLQCLQKLQVPCACLPWLLCATLMACQANKPITTQVLVVGGGTGGTAAGIAAARMGVKTLVVEETPWLGGMIAAAGVTCTDGNHNLPSGIWNEFRERIYAHYGGAKAVATGWVSHTNFEPHVSDSIWKAMAKAEKNLTILHGWQFKNAVTGPHGVTGATFVNTKGQTLTVEAAITIDATEMGDLMASANVPYSVGMEAGTEADENVGVTETNNIVQDLTYVAILKDYGPTADCTIAKPAGYTPTEFDGACTDYYLNKSLKAPTVDARKMLDYGRIPNGKYMINWPNAGNDTYLHLIDTAPARRAAALEPARQTTLRFIYFIQTQLGFKNLGLANDEFGSPDRLAWMPYYREGRRLKGLVRMNIRHIAEPFAYDKPLYRTGIAVGDYPIDHHHKKNPKAPQHLDFYPVPSYNVPLGALIPPNTQGLIVAEKGISVSNVVNGTTRLQPVVMLIGQAAGTLAALCIQQNKQPGQIPVRQVQEQLLKQGAYLMPYFDVPPTHQQFAAIQQIGATGILQGKGEPYQWANRTWFYPDSSVTTQGLAQALQPFGNITVPNTASLSVAQAIEIISTLASQTKPVNEGFNYSQPTQLAQQIAEKWTNWGLTNYNAQRPITRAEWAALLTHTLHPFVAKPLNHFGLYE